MHYAMLCPHHTNSTTRCIALRHITWHTKPKHPSSHHITSHYITHQIMLHHTHTHTHTPNYPTSHTQTPHHTIPCIDYQKSWYCMYMWAHMRDHVCLQTLILSSFIIGYVSFFYMWCYYNILCPADHEPSLHYFTWTKKRIILAARRDCSVVKLTIRRMMMMMMVVVTNSSLRQLIIICFLFFLQTQSGTWPHFACMYHPKMVDVETVMTGILDEWPRLSNHRLPVLLVVTAAFFLTGLPLTMQVSKSLVVVFFNKTRTGVPLNYLLWATKSICSERQRTVK